MSDNKETIETLIANVGDIALKRRLRTIIGRLDLSSPGTVLDLGCGDGMYLMVMSHLGKRALVGYDIDFINLQLAKRVIAPQSKTCLINGAANALSYGNESFDIVYATEVLEHLDDDKGALAEIARVLRSNGRLLVTVPNARYPFFGILLIGYLNVFLDSMCAPVFSLDCGTCTCAYTACRISRY